MNASVQHVVKGTTLRLIVVGRPGSTCDFETMGFTAGVGKALIRAFVATQGANTLESQRACIGHIKRFGHYAKDALGTPARLPAHCVRGFADWLLDHGFSHRTVGSACNAIIALLQWCQRNAPDSVQPGTEIGRLPYASLAKARSSSGQASRLTAPLIRTVLSACYSEIESIESRLWKIRELPLKVGASQQADLLMQLLSLGNGVLANQDSMRGARGRMELERDVAAAGGLRKFYRDFYLSIDDVFPFYMAILVQASANPQPLLKAQGDCIRQVPLRPDLERIVWDKRRANREQAPDFPKSKQWAAPSIIRRLLALNGDLREQASSRHRDLLFLCRNALGAIAPPSWQAIHDRFRAFRARHRLPKFDLRDVRPAGAKLHHEAGRSLTAAKHRLQHADVATTQIYTPLEDLKQDHDRVIHRFQGMLMAGAKKIASQGGLQGLADAEAHQAQTVFGFGCKNPRAGTAPGSRRGEVCMYFDRCATCPSALIVVDDPRSVARVVGAHDHLVRERERAVKEGWSQRFDALYASTLVIISRDVLPAISPHTLVRARELGFSSFPRLE